MNKEQVTAHLVGKTLPYFQGRKSAENATKNSQPRGFMVVKKVLADHGKVLLVEGTSTDGMESVACYVWDPDRETNKYGVSMSQIKRGMFIVFDDNQNVMHRIAHVEDGFFYSHVIGSDLKPIIEDKEMCFKLDLSIHFRKVKIAFQTHRNQQFYKDKTRK